MSTYTSFVVRKNITIPEKIWKELEEEIPEGKKSAFIAEAIEEKLRITKREKALKELAVLPPTFTDISDGAMYIRDSRREDDNLHSKR